MTHVLLRGFFFRCCIADTLGLSPTHTVVVILSLRAILGYANYERRLDLHTANRAPPNNTSTRATSIGLLRLSGTAWAWDKITVTFPAACAQRVVNKAVAKIAAATGSHLRRREPMLLIFLRFSAYKTRGFVQNWCSETRSFG